MWSISGHVSPSVDIHNLLFRLMPSVRSLMTDALFELYSGHLWGFILHCFIVMFSYFSLADVFLYCVFLTMSLMLLLMATSID